MVLLRVMRDKHDKPSATASNSMPSLVLRPTVATAHVCKQVLTQTCTYRASPSVTQTARLQVSFDRKTVGPRVGPLGPTAFETTLAATHKGVV